MTDPRPALLARGWRDHAAQARLAAAAARRDGDPFYAGELDLIAVDYDVDAERLELGGAPGHGLVSIVAESINGRDFWRGVCECGCSSQRLSSDRMVRFAHDHHRRAVGALS